VPSDHLELGRLGEDRAADWYRQHGYAILARNWRGGTQGSGAGEIDLVCARGELLVICEVKTRRSGTFGSPAEAVTAAKQQRLRRAALAFLAHPPGGRARYYNDIRFDVASVRGRTVEVLEGAF
jgi:putative endonuclease